MPASDANLRTAYAGIASTLYDQYGIDAGWPGIVPWPATEAIVNIESQGVNLPKNDSGAIGLMQVTAGGGEAYYYRTLTQDVPTEGKLQDPTYNLKVGIAGLAHDEIEVNRLGYPGWHYAGQKYFGGFGGNGPNDSASDGNTTGAGYRQAMVDYWSGTFGSATANYLEKDSWFSRTGTATSIDEQGRPNGSDEQRQVDNEIGIVPHGKDALDKALSALGSAGSTIANTGETVLSDTEKIGKLYDIVSDADTWLRVGIVVVGIAAVSIGLIATLAT
jgi:hypothetical protein